MRNLLKRALFPAEAGGAPIAPGLHTFSREIDGRIARYHLRVEADGYGTLIANVMHAVRLAPSGVVLAYGLLRGDEPAAQRQVARAFRGASHARVAEDLTEVRKLVEEMGLGRGAYPIRALDGDATLSRRALAAPLVADVVPGELADTLEVLRRLWDAGVPQVVLAPAGTARTAHLPRLVERAEDLGLVCGLRARATDLAGTDLLDGVAMAGLDHLDLFCASAAAASHDAIFGAGDRQRAIETIAACHALELCPTAVTPLLATTLDEMDQIAAELARLRVPAWTIFAIAEAGRGGGQVLGDAALRQAAATAEELADHFDLNLVWAPACERDPGVPLADQARRGPRVSGSAGVRVEADGSVGPKDGRARAAGNLLRDPWKKIWAHDAFRAWRESTDEPAPCDACPGLLACAAGCPADPATWARADGGAR